MNGMHCLLQLRSLINNKTVLFRCSDYLQNPKLVLSCCILNSMVARYMITCSLLRSLTKSVVFAFLNCIRVSRVHVVYVHYCCAIVNTSTSLLTTQL